MSVPRPAIVRLHELKPGDGGSFFAILAERNRGNTRDGKLFYQCRFRDARRQATYMVWSNSEYFERCESDWKPGTFFKIHAKYVEHESFGPQIEVLKIRPIEARDSADGFNPADYVEVTRRPAAEVFADLRALAEKIVDESLRRLTVGLLDRHAELLKRLPASHRTFYPYPGGWVEHTWAVTAQARRAAIEFRDRFTELRPPLNVDLVTAGACLHEIGRVRELNPTDNLAAQAEMTVDGRLIGHHVLGYDVVRDAIREQGSGAEPWARMLEHLMLSYLAIPEWGSPRLPLIPEVLIVHHCDDLDAKMEMFTRCLVRDPSDGPFTERDPVLQRQLFKGRAV